MTTLFLLMGAALGFIAHPALRRLWRAGRRADPATLNASEKAARERGRAEGFAEALSVMVDTDENAAIIEALGAGVLSQHGVKPLDSEQALLRAARDIASNARYAMWSGIYDDRAWEWSDAALTRASLSAVAPTPRGAYQSFLAQRAAAEAINTQLDELERVRKESAAEAAV